MLFEWTGCTKDLVGFSYSCIKLKPRSHAGTPAVAFARPLYVISMQPSLLLYVSLLVLPVRVALKLLQSLRLHPPRLCDHQVAS